MSDQQQIINEINNLKHEIVEARNMNIKTDNNMRAMFAEMKKITANQLSAERKMRISSVGAYVIFVVILAAAAWWVSGIRAGSLEGDIERLGKQIATQQQEIDGLKTDLETRQAAEKRAVYLMNLINQEKKAEAVQEFRKTERAAFSRVEEELLSARIDGFAGDLAQQHYEQGVSQWKIGGYKTAVQEFTRSLDYKPDMEHRGALQYFLGLSYLQLGKDENAIEALKAAISEDIRSDWANTARLKIAETLMKDKKYEDALIYMEGLPIEQLTFWVKQDILAKIKYVKRILAESNAGQ